jgi:hypothetical protein
VAVVKAHVRVSCIEGRGHNTQCLEVFLLLARRILVVAQPRRHLRSLSHALGTRPRAVFVYIKPNGLLAFVVRGKKVHDGIPGRWNNLDTHTVRLQRLKGLCSIISIEAELAAAQTAKQSYRAASNQREIKQHKRNHFTTKRNQFTTTRHVTHQKRKRKKSERTYSNELRLIGDSLAVLTPRLHVERRCRRLRGKLAPQKITQSRLRHPIPWRGQIRQWVW